VRHIEVIGAGKAGAGMAMGLEEALGPRVLSVKKVSGWLNVPADCVQSLETIHLHAARPAGANEPRAEGVAGAEEMLRRVASLGPQDLCIALISGGASALTPAPVPGVSLAEKLAITRHLSAAGANIAELNTVRKQLSRFKGGGLLRACRAGRLVSLVISDVLGDPLDIIASGPTVADTSTPAMALEILRRYKAESIAPRSMLFLENTTIAKPQANGCVSTTVVIGNNRTAVDAAAYEARQRGYTTTARPAQMLEGQAEDVGQQLASETIDMQRNAVRACLITGGEPVVTLAPESQRGRGGRNQQLVLAALGVLASREARGITILSGGTDGEDGPTDAAGAMVTDELIAEARHQGLDWDDALRRNDAYTFFAALGGLVKTGPTHTNVCDVRVAVTGNAE
jgi:hydroxypyruvate reductase